MPCAWDEVVFAVPPSLKALPFRFFSVTLKCACSRRRLRVVPPDLRCAALSQGRTLFDRFCRFLPIQAASYYKSKTFICQRKMLWKGLCPFGTPPGSIAPWTLPCGRSKRLLLFCVPLERRTEGLCPFRTLPGSIAPWTLPCGRSKRLLLFCVPPEP